MRAVFAFGRLNPPTKGHEKLVKMIINEPGNHFLFVSHTTNAVTDPLEFDIKLKFISDMFPTITVGHSSVRTVIQAMQYLEIEGYTDVVYVAGLDRVEQFTKLLNKYNGVEYQFDSITVLNAGDRDPDATDVSGVSATKLRSAALQGNFSEFVLGIPRAGDAEAIYHATRKGMNIDG